VSQYIEIYFSLSSPENLKLQQLITNSAKIKGFFNILEGSDDNRVSVGEVRVVDEVDFEYQLFHIRKDATIVNNKHFENRTKKIQDGLETTPSVAEKDILEIRSFRSWRDRFFYTRVQLDLCTYHAALNSHRDVALNHQRTFSVSMKHILLAYNMEVRPPKCFFPFKIGSR
jgi:hypothetical protein